MISTTDRKDHIHVSIFQSFHHLILRVIPPFKNTSAFLNRSYIHSLLLNRQHLLESHGLHNTQSSPFFVPRHLHLPVFPKTGTQRTQEPYIPIQFCLLFWMFVFPSSFPYPHIHASLALLSYNFIFSNRYFCRIFGYFSRSTSLINISYGLAHILNGGYIP